MNDAFGRPRHCETRTRKGLRFLLYALAAIYFAACAVVLLAHWFVTTQIKSHKEDIEHLLYDALGVRIEARSVDGGFHRLHPTFVLTDVALSRPDGPVSLVLPKVEAELSWSSIWHLEPRFRALVVSSPELTVRRLEPGRYDIGGFVINAGAGEHAERPFSAEQPFTRWLLAQDRLVLRNGRFTYVDEAAGRPQPVEVKNAQAVFDQRLLDWRAAARATLVEQDGWERTVEIKATVEKSLFSAEDNPLTWKGEAYLHADRINAARLLQRIGLKTQLESGDGAVRLWLNFNSGRIENLTTDLAVQNARLQLADHLKPMQVTSLSGRFTYAENKDGEHDFQARRLSFQGPAIGRFGPAELSAQCQTDAARKLLGCRFSADEVPVGVLVKLAASLPLPQSVRGFLAAKPVSGRLHQLEAAVSGDFDKPENWTFNGAFSELTLPAGADSLPGAENLSGTVRSVRAGEFLATLNSSKASLTFPGVFREPTIRLDKLSGEVRIETQPNIKLTFANVAAQNADASVSGRGVWTASGGAGDIDISGQILSAKAASVVKYLPNSIGSQALDYVSGAIMSGRAANGTWTVRGRLEHFPWDGRYKGEGLFRIEGDVVDGSMDFLPSGKRLENGQFEREALWPKLERISAHLLFEGNRMLITSPHAESMGLTASEARVEIPSFIETPPRLLIKGRLDGDLAEALRYLNTARMLHGFVGSTFEHASGSGLQSTLLDLQIPLSGKEEDWASLRWSTTTRFKETAFQFLPQLPAAKELVGELRVSEAGIKTLSPIEGRIERGPIRVSADTKNGVLTLGIQAAASPAELARIVDAPWCGELSQRLSGSTTVDVALLVPLSAPDQWTLQGSTDLAGLSSALPAPFEKTAASSWHTRFKWQPVPSKPGQSAADGARELSISIADRLQTQLEFTAGTNGLEIARGAVGIGTAAPAAGRGIRAAVKAPVIDITDWQKIFSPSADNAQFSPKAAQSIEAIIAASQANEDKHSAADAGHKLDVEKLIHTAADNALSAKLETVELATDRLSLGSDDFTHVGASLRRFDSGWHLSLRADQAAGQIEVLNAGTGESEPLSIAVKLTRLHLPASFMNGAGNRVGPPAATLPNLNVVIDDLALGNRRIGKLELEAVNSRTPTGLREWRIDHAAVRNAGGTLMGTGRWTERAAPNPLEQKYGPGETAVKIKADIQSAETVLKSLAVEDVLRETPADFDIRLRWQGMPSGFNLETLSGDIAGHAGAGVIVPVEPGAGRLLSLLSMQHLVRRLMLDFRDVAGKGLSFDSITAAATIKNGMYHSEKSTVIGSSATILVGGDIDLVNEILDLRALVLPSINAEGASIALAVLNPAVGIGTLLAQWMLKDQVSQMLSSEYEIRGSFDNPEVKKAAARKPEPQSLFP